MTIRRLLITVLALAGWVLAGIQAFLLYNILNRPFDDSIDLAARHTNDLLALHARNDQTDQIISWLTQYHGEAPDHQVMISFVHWATNNTDSAERLLGRLGTKPDLTERLAFGVADSGQTDAFCASFRESSSSVIKAILMEVKRFEPSCG